MATIKFLIVFLLGLIFDLYILLLLLRFLLQLLKTNFYNPISHFIFNITGFVKPLQTFLKPYRGFDYGLLSVIFVIEIIKLLLLFWMRFDVLPNVGGVAPWGIGEILNQFIDIFFYALLIRAILSWIGANFENPVYEITYMLTEFLLKPVRRFVPIISGFDFSPLIVALILKAFAIIAILPIIRWGQLLAIQGLS